MVLYSALFAYEALLRQAACGSSALSARVAALSNLVRQMVLTGRQLLMLGLTTSSSKAGMTNVERCLIIWSTMQFKSSKLGLPSSANVANHRERHMGCDFLSAWPSFSLQAILFTHSWPSLCTSQSQPRALLSFWAWWASGWLAASPYPGIKCNLFTIVWLDLPQENNARLMKHLGFDGFSWPAFYIWSPACVCNILSEGLHWIGQCSYCDVFKIFKVLNSRPQYNSGWWWYW